MASSMPRRAALYCAGVFLLAFGVSLCIRSGLGVSPNSSPPYTLSLITGLSSGLCQALVFTLFVLVQRLILGRDFERLQWLQVLTSILIGAFISLTSGLIGRIAFPDGMAARLGLSLAGCVFVGTGIFLYMNTGIVPMSAEGLLQAVAKKTGRSLPGCKLVIDSGMVCIAGLAAWIFLGSPWRSVGVGTVLAAVLCSRVLALHMRLYGPRYRAFLFGGTAESQEKQKN